MVERRVGWLKEDQAVGTRLDMFAVRYLGIVHLAMFSQYLRVIAQRLDKACRA